MSRFVFLYREASTPTPKELEGRMAKCLERFRDLEAAGHLATYGHPLNRTDGRVVRKGDVTDGPYAETKDIVIGFSVIEARDLEEAVRLADACPLVEAGCTIEVRPVLVL
jgi:hypothetical protein